MVVEHGFTEYSTDDLTKRQYTFIQGIQAALEDVEAEKCDYVIDEDATVLDKLRCEIAQEVLSELYDRIERNMIHCIVAMCDENAAKVMDMSRKKAEKKYGKKFVSEVLDE